MIQKIPAPIRFIVHTYLWGIVFFSLFRLLLFLLNFHSASGIPASVVAQSFFTGFRFDTVISGYILALPILAWFLLSLLKINSQRFNIFLFGFIIVEYSFCFLVLSTDIPWFEHQQTRLTVAALQWTNTPGMMLRIVFEDVRNYPSLAILILVIIGFFKICKGKYNRFFKAKHTSFNPYKNAVIYLFLFLLTFIAVRGRLSFKSPIRWGTAFTSEYNLTNQLGLNPVFTFIQTGLEQVDPANRHLTLMDDEQALSTVRAYYSLKKNSFNVSPLNRNVVPGGQKRKLNVVLVLMESMTSYNLKHFGNSENLTPVLDKLFEHSLSFTNFYSDGIHTFNGIYSSLLGFPSLPGKHHMKDLNHRQNYGGLAKTLEENNYYTIFFTAHDEQFDNAGGFLASNGFKEIVSEKDYDKDKLLNVLGIPDHLLFSESVNHLNGLSDKNKPFFATILTSSNHGPYEIPQGINFKPNSSDIRKQLVEYADWSIGQFLDSCGKQSWFDSTIFLFTGDHGAIVGDKDMYVTYHHVPLIIYAPSILSPGMCDSLGGQIDIFPTVMGLLNLPYTNNSFGIDLLKENRTFITFSYDEDIGALGKNDYFLNRKNDLGLFLVNPEARNIRSPENLQRMDSMQKFTNAVFQSHQWLLENKRVNN